MYTREIQEPRASPIEDGKPLTGTWDRAFDKVDLLEIRNPYPFPMPKWVRNWRIKEWQYFNAQSGNFLIEAVFCNFKLYRIAHVLVYDKQSGEKIIYRKYKPGKGWTLPSSLANSSIDSHSSNFYFRIHSWLATDTITLDIDIAAARQRPSLTAHLTYNVSSDITPMAVSLGITKRRTIYAYKAFTPIRGNVVLGERRISLEPDACSGFFCDYKGFFSYRLQTAVCSAMGFTKENRRFGFHIAENKTSEPNKNNENAFWVDGKLTPLPPVLITMPNGSDGMWFIQDIEGMVDLTFTPKEQNKSGIKLGFTKAEFNAPLGYYNGMLLNSEGEQIPIKNLFGMGEKFYLRL